MATELEVKLRLADPRAFVKRLKELGARRKHASFERNTLYDFPDRRLSKQLALLRLRVQTPAVLPPRVTFKCAPAKRLKAVLHHDEFEFCVSDARQADAVLRGLGLVPWWAYEGKRTRYALDGAEVSVDEMAELGWFAEIEAKTPAAIARVVNKLGFSKKDFIPKSYRALAAEHLTRKGFSWRDLVF